MCDWPLYNQYLEAPTFSLLAALRWGFGESTSLHGIHYQHLKRLIDKTLVYPPSPLKRKENRRGMCIAVQYVYQCYSCHSTVIKDRHHGPRYPCPLIMANGAGLNAVPLLGHCPTGFVWTSHRRRCCDDIDPRAAAHRRNGSKGEGGYPYFLLRTEKLCLWCEVQGQIRQLGIHAESEVLDTTTTGPTTSASTTPAPSFRASDDENLTPCGCSIFTYWGEADHRRRCHHRQDEEEEDGDDDDDDDEDDEEGGAPL